MRYKAALCRVVVLVSLAVTLAPHSTAAAAAQDSTADADGTWVKLGVAGTPPSDRNQHGAIYDPIGQRMILFGGAETLEDTWSLSLDGFPRWTRLTPSSSPSGRKAMAMTYDAFRHRLVMFGGYSDDYLNDVWALSLGGSHAWTRIVPQGGLPAPRYGHVGIYDPVGDRLVIFGGTTGGNEAWALDLDSKPEWYRIGQTGTQPSARYYSTAVYDPVRRRMVVYGGLGGTDEVWALPMADGSPWERLIPSGAGIGAFLHTAVYDDAYDRMVVFNGSGADIRTLSWGGQTPGPRIGGFLPAGGQVGDAVEIFGSGLAGALRVSFKDVEAPIVENTSNRILTRVPEGATSGPISVTTSLGTAISTAAFFVGSSPAIQEFAPDVGPPGTIVDIHGQNLLSAIRVAFGPQSSAAFTVESDTHIRATVDAQAMTGQITVTTLVGTAVSLKGFRVVPPPPTITNVLPAGGRIGDRITILGANFHSPLELRFGAFPSAFDLISTTQIEALIPERAVTAPITIATEGGQITTDFEFFVGETPVITAADPASGKIGSVVILSGRHFTGATRVAFGPSSSASYEVQSDTRIRAIVDGQASSGPVSVTTPADRGTSEFDFQVLPFDTSATIANVRDLLADQGGRVVVRWTRSDLDAISFQMITGYRVWRRAALDLGAADAVSGTLLAAAGAPGFWEPLGEVPASHSDGYAFTAATTRDSTEEGNPYTAFFIQTLTRDPFTFFVSAVDSGYSVDNLAPSKPPHFTALYSGRSTALRWSGSLDEDLAGYRLYRGVEIGFAPGKGNLVFSGRDTAFVDSSRAAYYKLCAVDIHGNESRYALATPGGSTTGVALAVAVHATPREVRLRWYLLGASGVEARVYRRSPGESWRQLGAEVSNESGMVVHVDATVVPGTRLEYRLGVVEGDTEAFSDAISVRVPDSRLSLATIAPNPLRAGQALSVEFSLPYDGRVRVEVFDVMGRAVRREDLGWKEAGRHGEKLESVRDLRTGSYYARLSNGREDVTRSFSIHR